MLLVTSSFLASILTDRILLVQWENYGTFSGDIKQEYFRKLFVAPGGERSSVTERV